MRKGLLVIAAGVFMLGGVGALGQGPGDGRGEPKPSDCLREEKSIRPPATPGNAAIEYFKVWDSLPASEYDAITHFGNVPFAQNEPVKLAPAQRELCLKHQDYIEGLMRCAAMPECDWGVQHQFGDEFRAPHLRLLRESYRALKMDYLRCVEDGRGIDAAARLAAMVRASNQVRTDQVWFSGLVATGHMYGAWELTLAFVKGGLITPATARQLLDAYKSIRTDDLYSWVSAMDEERWLRTQWPRSECTGEFAGARYIEKEGGVQVFWPQAPVPWFICGFNEQRLNADLDRYGGYLSKVVPLWADGANDVKLRELELEALEGQFGAVASVQASGLELIRRNLVRARRQIGEAIAALEGYIKREEKRAE
jgi:hypothetical protein